ncbi:MAG: hypothetical protein PHF97_02575 [Bacteroidales bacterium]|nr:hypothetical protein [Bacteroidales bacterium]MDD4602677.1 hypothetical protein [Bacteroidales bacterium]
MNITEIELLLGKYLDGDTTLDEENFLRTFFQNEEIPAHLKFYRVYFNYTQSAQQEKINPEFEQQLTFRLTTENQKTPIVTIQSAHHRFFYWSSIAAGILLLVGLYFTFQNDFVKNKNNANLSANQKIAYIQARDALMLVSGNLNVGLKQVERFQVLGTVLNEMQAFGKFYQYETLILNPDFCQNQSIKTTKP